MQKATCWRACPSYFQPVSHNACKGLLYSQLWQHTSQLQAQREPDSPPSTAALQVLYGAQVLVIEDLEQPLREGLVPPSLRATLRREKLDQVAVYSKLRGHMHTRATQLLVTNPVFVAWCLGVKDRMSRKPA